MARYKLLISYDGTLYAGWQLQPNATSIQGLVESALERFFKSPLRVTGASRTDSGVHALGQVAHFTTDLEFECSALLKALNGMLPYDVRILSLELIGDDFHAQYSSTGKEYHYHVCMERIIAPFHRLYRHHFYYPSSLPLMREAAKKFIGTHDFASFTNAGSTVTSTVRTITRLDIIEEPGGIRFEFEGNGFLYKMVRNIVGLLLDIGRGKRAIEEIEPLFEAKDRRKAAMAAPGKGLFLIKVHYASKES